MIYDPRSGFYAPYFFSLLGQFSSSDWNNLRLPYGTSGHVSEHTFTDSRNQDIKKNGWQLLLVSVIPLEGQTDNETFHRE